MGSASEKRTHPDSGFFSPGGATKAPKAASWQTVRANGGVYLWRRDPEAKPCLKDGTLVTHHGSFAANAEDWQFFSKHVAVVLRSLHDQGFSLAVFSNQGGIKGALDGKRAAITKAYFHAAILTAGVPVTAYVAPQKDCFRKPERGMWEAFVRENGEVDLSQSFYVGDAAGRPGDHSADDSLFAANLGLKFYLPEEAFTEGVAWAPLATAPAANVALPPQQQPPPPPPQQPQQPQQPSVALVEDGDEEHPIVL